MINPSFACRKRCSPRRHEKSSDSARHNDRGSVGGKQAPELVTIELSNAPADAQIDYKGVLHVGKMMRIEKGDQPVTLTVLAEGYRKNTIEVVPSGDKVIEIRMDPLKDADRGAGKKKKSKKKSSGDPEGSGSKEDIDHNWDYPGD